MGKKWEEIATIQRIKEEVASVKGEEARKED